MNNSQNEKKSFLFYISDRDNLAPSPDFCPLLRDLLEKNFTARHAPHAAHREFTLHLANGRALSS